MLQTGHTPELTLALQDGAISAVAIKPLIPVYAAQWFPWTFGFAMLVFVIFSVLHYSDGREFVSVAENAQPQWLAIALILQSGTYLTQGKIWRMVLQVAGVMVPSTVTLKLSLAKLFIDQALPSAGISGTVLVVRALERRGISRAVVMALVVVDRVSYYGAYVLTLLLALAMAAIRGHMNPLIFAPAFFFLLFGVTLMPAALMLAGRTNALPRWLMHVPLLKSGVSFLGEADSSLARSFSLICKGTAYHVVIVLLDVATVWILIRSLGEIASPGSVFTSFMSATLLRTISIVPGGLGVYEAASVMTLQHAGISLPVALASTLLFRGVSFWLPMAPGLLFCRALQNAR